MKKINFILLLLSILICSCKNQKNNINVSIDGVSDGKKVWLKKLDDKKIIVIDSTIVKNNTFGFYKKIEEPMVLGIFIDNLENGIYPLIDVKNNITIIAYKDSLIKSKVIGSKLHIDLQNLRDFRIKRELTISKLRRSLKLLTKKDTAEFSNIRLKIYNLSNDIFYNDWNYAKDNPNSVVAVMVLSKMNVNPYSRDSIKKVFDKFDESIKNSIYAKQLKIKLENSQNVPVELK